MVMSDVYISMYQWICFEIIFAYWTQLLEYKKHDTDYMLFVILVFRSQFQKMHEWDHSFLFRTLPLYILKRESNLGLSISHRLNYEAASLTTQPPRHGWINIMEYKLSSINQVFLSSSIFSNMTSLLAELSSRC